jgi:hypothetical protein
VSLEFIAGAVTMLGVVLIASWVRDRWKWRYRGRRN